MTKFNNLFIGSFLSLLAVSAFAQAPTSQQDQDRLQKAMSDSIMPMEFSQSALTGTGGEWLVENAAAADIVMLGEMHGIADIAHTAQTLGRSLSAAGTTVYVSEISPTAALALEPLLKSDRDELEAYMADARRAISFAFMNMREETEVARAILQRTDGKKTALWGLDQEFITSGPLLVGRLETYVRTPAQKAAVDDARQAILPLFMSLGKIPPEAFSNLNATFAEAAPEARRLIADMELSNRIYAGQNHEANRLREDLMKRDFLEHWRAAADKRGRTPKILMKFGSYHLTAGLSPTMVPSLGSFVRALALAENKTVFSAFLICGADGEQLEFNNKAVSCKEEFDGAAAELAPYLLTDGAATVFRTAPLRAIPGTLKRLGFGEDLRSYIFSYEALVVLNRAKASRYFTAPDPSFFEQE